MVKIPDIMDMILGTSKSYARKYELADQLDRFPEATARRDIPGYYGPIASSMKDELKYSGAITGIPYGAPRGSVLRQQQREASERVKSSLPLMEAYIRLREEGHGQIQKAFNQFYSGNRTGPITPEDMV